MISPMRRWVAAAVAVLVVALGVVLSGVLGGAEVERGVKPGADEVRTVAEAGFGSAVARAHAQTDAAAPKAEAPSRFALQPEADPLPVVHDFGDPPRAGMMFDLDTGEVLWEHHADRELPIASLTKMMTAWVIASRHRPGEKVLISRDAVRTGGSKVGVLPQGRRVKLGALMDGLLLVSGNDAAVALAEHDAGSVKRFVERMNDEARRLGMSCTHFTSPHGLQDAGNHSCPRDLALLARADLSEPLIAEIARSDHVRRPFPIKGGYLDLYNINPFIDEGSSYTGLKTGYTEAAGRCYVTTAERGGRELGVVLLDSPNPLEQVPKLLELGAQA
jgi:D-alanyl-D-alanine carboxypeptidase